MQHICDIPIQVEVYTLLSYCTVVDYSGVVNILIVIPMTMIK